MHRLHLNVLLNDFHFQLGDYIRRVAAEVEARVSTEMKKRCTEQILPVLGQTLNRIKHGLRPTFAYDSDLSGTPYKRYLSECLLTP